MKDDLRVVTTYMTNPFEPGQGGGVRYVRNLLAATDERGVKVLFLGIGSSERTEGATTLIPITSRKYCGYLYFLIRLMIRLPFLDLSSYKVVHVHRSYFAIPFILLKPNLKIVCSLHGRTFAVFQENFGSGMFSLVKKIFMAIELFALRNIDYLVPVSGDVVRSFSSKYPEFFARKKDEIRVIGSMLDLSAFTPQESSYLADLYGSDQKYLVFLGRMAPVKDIRFLIEMFASQFQARTDIKLVLIGHGESIDEYQDLASQLCQNNPPIFHGEVSADEVPSLISSASVALLCSQHEASPTVVKEALASGVPVVSNHIGDVDEFIIDGVNGHIVEKDFDAYGRAILALLDPVMQRAEVSLASKASLHKCTVDYVGGEYLDIYESLV